MMRIWKVKTFTGKWENADGEWEGFLEEVTILLVWARESTAGRGDSKCAGREEKGHDSSRKSHQGVGGLRPCGTEGSWGARLPTPERPHCVTPNLGDLGKVLAYWRPISSSVKWKS